MFPDDSQGCFDKNPKNESGPPVFRLLFPFVAQIIERLLHGLSKSLSEASWIESEEFLVKNTNIHPHLFLIAVRNTYKTGPLVNEETGEPYDKGEQNQPNDDQMDRMRKQAASRPQGPDDRPTGN